ncbi:MAG: benzoate-CoA ligase family protein [Kofleriaceae bacterium]|nr:benzoate-CoA ligase family protein [Kofleriaceae bacterium]
MTELDPGFPPTFPPRFNMADYFLDARLREGLGERIAVRVGDKAFTYAEVQSLSNRASHALRDRGIDLEDRVLLLLPDGIEFVCAWLGILKAGATFCMGNPLVTESDFDYLLGYTRARAVIAHASTLDRLAPVIAKHPRCKVRLLVAGGAPGFERWDTTLASSSDRTQNADTSRDDVAGWLFTSGTSGAPKGAIHLHHDFPFNTECYAKRVLGITKDDVFVSVSRLFFGYATGTNLMFPFSVGGTAVLFPDKPTPQRMFAHCRDHGVTVLTNVPAMIRQMVDHAQSDPASAAAALGKVRMCLSAGEALPPELFGRWHTLFPKAEILDGIGSAELFHIYVTNYPGEAKPGSLGRVVPGYEAIVKGPDGAPVPDGEIGRLWVKGDSAAVGYFGDHAKSKETFYGDWVASADLFRRESTGDFYYAGRADDMLKVRGMFVSPLEVEDCLATHPAVAECAVVGADDEEGLVIPKAFVVLRDGHSGDAAMTQSLQDHVRERLAKYKYPRVIAYLPSLPRNDRGKILRRELR